MTTLGIVLAVLSIIGWPIAVLILVFRLSNMRIEAYADSAKASASLLDDYRHSHEKVSDRADKAIEIISRQSSDSLAKLTEQFSLLLRHDAAMTGAQLEVLYSALREQSQSSNSHAMKLIQTFLVAHTKASQAASGNGDGSLDLVSELAALNQSEPPDLMAERETINPMQQ